MKYRYLVYCLLLLPFLGKGQGFEAVFGTTINDYGRKVFEVPNEDAYLVVSFRNDIQEDTSISIAKFDAVGNLLWQKQIDGYIKPNYWPNPDIVIENDGIRLAYPYFLNGGDCLKIKKINFNGDVVLDITYSLPQYFFLYKLEFLPDNSMIAVAFNTSDDSSHLYKFDQNGDIIWTKEFPSSQLYAYECIDLETLDDGSFLTITQEQFSSTGKLVISKFNAAGDLSWQTLLTQQINFKEAYILPFPDGNSYFVWGRNAISQDYGTFAARIGNNGQVLWHQNFTSNFSFIAERGVIHGEDNTLYLTGTTGIPSSVNANPSKIKLLQLGDDGNVLWEITYGEAFGYSAGQLIQTQDRGFFIAAETHSVQFDTPDPFALKTAANGELIWSWQTVRMNGYVHNDAIQTSNGEYLVLGTSLEAQGYDNNLVKLTPYGSVYDNLIQGRLFHDTDLSCSQNNGETNLANWKIKSTGYQTTYAITTSDDSYRLFTNNDSTLVTAIPPNGLWAACPDPATVIFDAAPYDTTTLHLFAQAVKNCPLLEVDVSTPFLRRCFVNTYSIQCKNTGTVSAENAQFKVFLDPYFEYIGASANLASQDGNAYIFDIGTLGVNETYILTLQVEISCDAELVQEHCLSVRAIADNLCSDVDNTLSHTRECQPNIGSFDPNDKRAFSQGTLTDRFIAADSIIEYQIRFQNTGTDTAFNVVVTDTLSSLLDIESIIAGASSHAYQLELERNNILKFVFKDILLPDSNVNEAASHGFVKFRIRHKPGLVPGDVIPNKAAIFFDFNEAVITNELELEIKSPLSVVHPPRQQLDLLEIYPQPADVVYFELKSNGSQQSSRLEIFNLLGQRIHEQPLKEGVNAVAHLPAGQHFYRFWEDGAVVETGKVVVIR